MARQMASVGATQAQQSMTYCVEASLRCYLVPFGARHGLMCYVTLFGFAEVIQSCLGTCPRLVAVQKQARAA